MTDLDALAAAATAGPWRATEVQRNGWSGVYRDTMPVFLTNAIEPADAAFIVALVNAYRDGKLVAVEDRDRLRAAAQLVLDQPRYPRPRCQFCGRRIDDQMEHECEGPLVDRWLLAHQPLSRDAYVAYVVARVDAEREAVRRG